MTTPLLPQVLPYDYYGAYRQRAHEDYVYGRLLGHEYTFDFPPHHDVVGRPIPDGTERRASPRLAPSAGSLLSPPPFSAASVSWRNW